MLADRKPGFNTLTIHAGAHPDPATGARTTPIYQTTSYVFENVDHAAALLSAGVWLWRAGYLTVWIELGRKLVGWS